MSKPKWNHERFCKRCQAWVKPYPGAATLYGITTYDEMCPGCNYAVNFSEKRFPDPPIPPRKVVRRA